MSQYGSNNKGIQVVSFHKWNRSCNECWWVIVEKTAQYPFFSPIRVSFVCWKGVCERWFHALFIFTSCVISCLGNLGLCLKPRVCRVKIWSISICLFAFAAMLGSIYSVKTLQHYKISCARYTFWGLFNWQNFLGKSSIMWIFRESDSLCQTLERVNCRVICMVYIFTCIFSFNIVLLQHLAIYEILCFLIIFCSRFHRVCKGKTYH